MEFVTAKIKITPGALVGIKTKLGYVFYSYNLKDLRVMNYVLLNQNFEEIGILKQSICFKMIWHLVNNMSCRMINILKAKTRF